MSNNQLIEMKISVSNAEEAIRFWLNSVVFNTEVKNVNVRFTQNSGVNREFIITFEDIDENDAKHQGDIEV